MKHTMRLPFFYGWVVVAVTFVTMAIGVNARTAFSLFFPPIISEFGWERGVTAGAFSFGFVVSGMVSPLIGRLMDRAGPRAVMELGVVLMGGGLLLAPLTSQPWHLYVTIGVMVGAGSVCLGYSGQSLFLPNWFIRKRGFAIGIAFAGVGIGSVTLLPWVQHMIEQTGWRTACTAMGLMILIVLAPINLFLHRRPEDIGLRPDGDAAPAAGTAKPVSNIVDPVWVGTEWTLRRAVATARFWWIALGYFCGLYIWYAVQVHQTKFLLDIGLSANVAVWALGIVSLLGIPGQILARPCLRPDRAGMGVGDQLRGLCDLFRGADGTEIPAVFMAGLSHGVHARRARLRPHLDHGRSGVRDFSGQAPGQHLRYDHAGGIGRRRGGTLGHRLAL
ncbi:MFS family permease [Bradyrhizobium sp. LM6.10]